MKSFLFPLFFVLLFFAFPTSLRAQTCGADLYENKNTFCSSSFDVLHLINNGQAPYQGCGIAEICYVGADVGQNECGWVMDTDGLKFCFGGFVSDEELRASRFEVSCENNCGGANIINATGSLPPFSAGDTVQSHSNADAPTLPDSNGGRFSCVLAEGGFDESVVNAVRWQIERVSNACGVLGVGEFLIPGAAAGRIVSGASRVVRMVSLPLRVGVSVPAGGALAAISTQECLDAANKYYPTFVGQIIKADGQLACSRELTVSVDAKENILSEGDNYGAPPAGTVLQGTGPAVVTCPGSGGYKGINTAIGCIGIDTIETAKFLLVWSIGVGGGVALVLIAYGGILFMFSQGNLDRVKEAKSVMVAAISGLLLIIFSTFLLRVVGVNILQLF